jgi:hypothetical protein
MICCEQMKEKYELTALYDLPELKARVERVGGDPYLVVFRCRRCGCVWEERWRSGGHGDISDLVRMPRDETSRTTREGPAGTG